ncbi:MAG: RNA polymerase sigma factor, partial [Planctomycetota bacterium]
MGAGNVTVLARSADLCWAVSMDDRRELGEGPLEMDGSGADYEIPAAPDRMSERLRPEDVLGELAWLERLSRRLIADPHLADDLFQSTLAVALERPPLRGQLRGWLRMVLKNLWNDELRRRVRDSDGLARHGQEQGELALPSADELAERAALQLELGHEVMSLEPELRDLVLWHFYGELSAMEIARRTDYSESQVRRRLKRALDKLRVRLDEHQLDQGAERGSARSSWMGLLAVGVSASELAPAARASTATAASGSVSSTTSALVAWTAAASLLLGGLLWVAHEPRVPPATHFVPLESTSSVAAAGATEALVRGADGSAPRVALEAALTGTRERLEVQVLSASGGAPLDEARVQFVDAAGVSHALWRFDGEAQANFGLGVHPDPRRSVRHEPAHGLGWLVAQAPGHRLTRAARRWPPTTQVDRARLELAPERRIAVKVIDAASGGVAALEQWDRHVRSLLSVRTSSRALSGERLTNLPDDPADACAAWQQESPHKEGIPDPFGVLVPFGDAPFWAHLCLGEHPLASLRINAATRELVFRVELADLASFRPVTARLVDASGAPLEGSLFLTATGRSAFMEYTGERGPGELVQYAPPGSYSCLAEYQPGDGTPRGERLQQSFPLELRPDDPEAWNLGDIVLEAPRPSVPVELVFHDVAPAKLYVENWTAEREGTSRFMYTEWHME